ncbi:response regulator transcription factor [Silanimonas sp.]|jgi:two-component system invasion response regulator UvrY|uniref:response regulator n=1 Tax=Silanimonas sp. TaxID=1929290 RepID=UPI0022C1C632|nr:response regulator transcription factor [Silanimonas sp.]MCZ8062117.1 response regulator transcription factor [Silanimonas sp.]MCZ8114523.1 response regulator transcription factor [Silanimonas sp.]
MTLIRLLIVDDHDAFLNAAERHLRRVAHVAIIGRGRNGIEAVALADELKPDVVVLDLAMPEMGGLQATRLIKAQDEPPFVVIASHFDDVEHREHSQRAGADAFISKLNYIAELLPIIDSRAGKAQGGA